MNLSCKREQVLLVRSCQVSPGMEGSVVTVLVEAHELVVNDVRVIMFRVRLITGLLVSSLVTKWQGAFAGHLWGYWHCLVHCWNH